MAILKFQKVNTLPGTLTPDTLYLVKDGNAVRIFVSDSAGTTAVPVVGDSSIDPFLLMGVNNV